MNSSTSTPFNESPVPPSTGHWLHLGHTAGHRAAEIVAGLRAQTFPSPEFEGLSSPSGRRFARLLNWLSGDEAATNATGGRHLCLTHLAEKILKDIDQPKIIVEMAAGFSGRGLVLARDFPQAQVFEVDLPEVIASKRQRVNIVTHGAPPPNLHWISADLQEVSLAEVIGADSVDLVIAEGLLPYFSPQEVVQIASEVHASLSSRGVMLADIVSKQGWSEVESKSFIGTWLFKRQVDKFKSKMDSKEMARSLFEQAGYSRTHVQALQEVAQQVLPDRVVANVSFLIEAHQ